MLFEKEIDKSVIEGNYNYLLPVDTWIFQVFNIVNTKDYKENINILKRDMIEQCQKNNVDPVYFNQGCWYLGFKSLDILIAHLHEINIE